MAGSFTWMANLTGVNLWEERSGDERSVTARGYSQDREYPKLDRINYPDIINITDAIQGIFDHI